jgi:acyl-coenzyme A synthetase/AMP-(fatty) acid ligase
MNFLDTILFHGKAVPDKAAIILIDRVVTFGMFADAVLWVEQRARTAGIARDATVAVQIGNPIRQLIVACVLLRIGAISLTIRGDQLGEMAAVGAQVLLSDQPAGPSAGFRRIHIDDGWFTPIDVAPNPDEIGFASNDKVFRLSLTSGTTGHAKAIATRLCDFHDNIALATSVFWAHGADRTLVLVGMSSSWAFSEAIRCLWSGRTVCFAASAPEALRMIPLFNIEGLVASPQQLRVLVDSHADEPISCASLRFIMVSGSQLASSLATEIRSRLCSRVIVNYGSTEAGKTAMGPLDQMRGIPGAAGFLLPWVEAEIVDGDGHVLPAGQEGLLRIRVAGGGAPYRPGEPAAPRIPHWFYPGDIGKILPDRLLVITGRTQDMINAGGLKVAPEVIEELVAGRADIADAGAVGMTGASGIEEIWLAIVARGTVDIDDVLAWCRNKAPALAPHHIRLVNAIPRNDMGKVARNQLADILAKA